MSREQLESYFKSKKEEDDVDKLLNRVKYSEKLSHVHSLDSFLEGLEKKLDLGKYNYCTKNDSFLDIRNQMPSRQETVRQVKKRNKAFRAAAKILREMQHCSKHDFSSVKNAITPTVETKCAEDSSCRVVEKCFDKRVDDSYLSIKVNKNSKHECTHPVHKSILSEEINSNGGFDCHKVTDTTQFKDNNNLVPLTRSKVIEIERELQHECPINNRQDNGSENLQAEKYAQCTNIHVILSQERISSGSHSRPSIVNDVLKPADKKTTGQNASDRSPKWIQPSTLTTTSNGNTNAITHQKEFQSHPDRSNNETVATIRNRASENCSYRYDSSNSKTSMRRVHNESENYAKAKNSNNDQALRFFGVPFKATKSGSKSTHEIYHNIPKRSHWR